MYCIIVDTETSILFSPHFVLTLYWGIFFLCFAYFHLRSRRSECRSRSTDDKLCLHHLLFGNACISGKLLPFYYIYNNKSQLLLHPYMPSHLINLKNQLRYRLLNMWKLFCVCLLSSFLVTNDNKVALAVVCRKKLWINNYENFVVFR